MARMTRAEVLDPGQVETAHVHSRTTRRCFLFGDDPVSGKNFDHRKVWIERYLRDFAAAFGIDLIAYALMSNHFHLILRSRPDVVATWDDREVARRWLMLCPARRCADGSPAEPTEPEINSIAGCPIKRAEIRSRLSNISWWMRLLCQRVAMRANQEEGESGRFFQDRYRATRLADEASILACAAYVDLNPIRAAIAETVETSEFTSAQRRMLEAGLLDDGQSERGQSDGAAASLNAPALADAPSPGPMRQALANQRPDFASSSDRSFLSPLTIDELNDPVGPHVSANAMRCSDKGFLAMSLVDYVSLLDWTARQVRPGKRGSTPLGLPPIVERLGLSASVWCELVADFGRLFGSIAGHAETVDSQRSRGRNRRFHLRRRARELMTAH